MFSAKMLAIANSYVNNIHDAEDILLNSFLKFFKMMNAENGKAFSFGSGKL
jgi:RNA polymerase sigma-70 factor (ECF subfamily)